MVISCCAEAEPGAATKPANATRGAKTAARKTVMKSSLFGSLVWRPEQSHRAVQPDRLFLTVAAGLVAGMQSATVCRLDASIMADNVMPFEWAAWAYGAKFRVSCLE
jgi:hypothetical protein